MSHAPPITLEITAIRQDQIYQGTESVAAETWAAVWTRTREATEIESAIPRLYRKSDFHFDGMHRTKVALQTVTIQTESAFWLPKQRQLYIIPPGRKGL
jgi:hypothetical protein